MKSVTSLIFLLSPLQFHCNILKSRPGEGSNGLALMVGCSSAESVECGSAWTPGVEGRTDASPTGVLRVLAAWRLRQQGPTKSGLYRSAFLSPEQRRCALFPHTAHLMGLAFLVKVLPHLLHTLVIGPGFCSTSPARRIVSLNRHAGVVCSVGKNGGAN